MDIPWSAVSPIIGKVGLSEESYNNQLRLNNIPKNIKEVEDNVLEDMIRDGKEIDVNLGNTFLKDDNPDHLKFMNHYWAMYELRNRHGEDYILPLLGLRQPKTLFEKFMNYTFGDFPKDV